MTLRMTVGLGSLQKSMDFEGTVDEIVEQVIVTYDDIFRKERDKGTPVWFLKALRPVMRFDLDHLDGELNLSGAFGRIVSLLIDTGYTFVLKRSANGRITLKFTPL